METFADVLHTLIDHVLAGDFAEKAHGIIDRASGTRTAAPDTDTTGGPTDIPPPDRAASEGATDVPSPS